MRMDGPILSVIIPTHKRPQLLRRCLEYIERQTISGQIEIIVVNDGPGEETKSAIVGALHAMPSLQYFEIPKSHQGVARNRGVEKANGKYVLFIGDDIFLAPDACARHVAAQDDHRAVLGFTTWDPACGITDVMRWLESSGWQFGYPMIAPYAHQTIPSSIQHRFTYTSHISLPTETAKKFPFRDDVTLYGWEDIEWGFRLKKAGVQLFYEPDAGALHHHTMLLPNSIKRMEILGKSAAIMDRIVPELKLRPRGWKLFKYRIASMLPGMRGVHVRAFLRGIGTCNI